MNKKPWFFIQKNHSWHQDKYQFLKYFDHLAQGNNALMSFRLTLIWE